MKKNLNNFRFRKTIDGQAINLSFRQTLALNESYIGQALAKESFGPRYQQTLNGLVIQGLMEVTARGWKRTRLGGRVARMIDQMS